ncbi:MAG: hypothetical protein KGO02_24090 [Alphaproteobacteria bacterium]|nr:hypothetical protein [Alphaproteobacteria bacterium]
MSAASPLSIQPLPIWHFLLSLGVLWAFGAAIYGIVIGLGIHAVKPSEAKSPGRIWAMIVLGVGLALGAAWQQATELQQENSDARNANAQQLAAEARERQISDELVSVKSSLNTLSGHYNDVSGALSKIASAANVSSQKSVTQIVSAIIDKLPKPALPVGIRIKSLQPKPLVTGMVPEVTMYLMNDGPPTYMSLMYLVEAVPNVNGCFDDYRGNCEQILWSHFLASPSRKNYLEIPTGQPASIDLIAVGHVMVQANENPMNTRIYFLARAYDRRGKKLFDSCSYVEPNPPPNTPLDITYCIAHND